MDSVGLQVPTQNLHDFPLFGVSPSFNNCPCVRCDTVANSVYSDLDTCRRQILELILLLVCYYCVNINYSSLLFGLCFFRACPVYCHILFVFVCCAVSVIGHLVVGSAL
jgi:hypothetical protein